MKTNEWINKWIKKSENDLLAVEIILNSKSAPADVVCFHCQQAAEKQLKAYCIKLDVVFEKSHDLIYLLDLVNKKTNGGVDDDIYLKCEKINDYAATIRYPMEKYEPTLPEAKEAYPIALRVKEYILQKLQ